MGVSFRAGNRDLIFNKEDLQGLRRVSKVEKEIFRPEKPREGFVFSTFLKGDD